MTLIPRRCMFQPRRIVMKPVRSTVLRLVSSNPGQSTFVHRLSGFGHFSVVERYEPQVSQNIQSLQTIGDPSLVSAPVLEFQMNLITLGGVLFLKGSFFRGGESKRSFLSDQERSRMTRDELKLALAEVLEHCEPKGSRQDAHHRTGIPQATISTWILKAVEGHPLAAFRDLKGDGKFQQTMTDAEIATLLEQRGGNKRRAEKTGELSRTQLQRRTKAADAASELAKYHRTSGSGIRSVSDALLIEALTISRGNRRQAALYLQERGHPITRSAISNRILAAPLKSKLRDFLAVDGRRRGKNGESVSDALLISALETAHGDVERAIRLIQKKGKKITPQYILHRLREADVDPVLARFRDADGYMERAPLPLGLLEE